MTASELDILLRTIEKIGRGLSQNLRENQILDAIQMVTNLDELLENTRRQYYQHQMTTEQYNQMTRWLENSLSFASYGMAHVGRDIIDPIVSLQGKCRITIQRTVTPN